MQVSEREAESSTGPTASTPSRTVRAPRPGFQAYRPRALQVRTLSDMGLIQLIYPKAGRGSNRVEAPTTRDPRAEAHRGRAEAGASCARAIRTARGVVGKVQKAGSSQGWATGQGEARANGGSALGSVWARLHPRGLRSGLCRRSRSTLKYRDYSFLFSYLVASSGKHPHVYSHNLIIKTHKAP